jgi:hypothetical protein
VIFLFQNKLFATNRININQLYIRGQTYWRLAKFALLSLLIFVCNALSLLLENGNTERLGLTIFVSSICQLFRKVVVISDSVLILYRVFVLKAKG